MNGQISQFAADILEAMNHDMDNLTLTFNTALHQQDGTVAGDGTLTLVDIWADNQVGDGSFIFEGNEQDAIGSAGALAHQNETGHTEAAPMRAETFACQFGSANDVAPIESRPNERNRMGFE